MGTVRFFHHSTQLFRYHIPTEFVLLAVIEFLILMLSLYLGLELRFIGSNWDWWSAFGGFTQKALLYATIMQLSMLAFGLYQRQAGRFIEMLLLRIACGLLLGLIPLGVSFYFAPTLFFGRGVLALTVAVSFILISIIRLFFRIIVKERNMWSRVLVLGSGEKANLVRRARKAGELEGLNIIAYVSLSGDSGRRIDDDVSLNDGNERRGDADCMMLNKPLVQYVEEKDVDEIVLAMDDRRSAEIPARDLLDCKMSGVDILDMVTFFERRTGKIRLDMMDPSWIYLSDGFHMSTFRSMGKRIFDITAVLLLFPVALPMMLLATVMIFIESLGRGSVLYSQTRVKRDGELFQIYKFRSMAVDAEKDGVARWAAKNDSRVTRVGSMLRKCRLDELPQLFNVLKGDMSFVGPRPERPEFIAQFSDKIPYYHERHRVKPGLTGWAQISYSYGDSEDDSLEKLQYDLYYVKNYSFFLDLLILLQTAEVVLLRKGAH